MLLIDGNSHEVHEIDDACVLNHVSACTHIPFTEFESLAYCPAHAGLFANMLLDRRGVIPIKLKPSGGIAWGARVAVFHNGELPVDTRVLGTEFVFVWPQSTAIHAFFELQEAARRRGAAELVIGQSMRPSWSFQTHGRAFGNQDVQTTRCVETRKLTVEQRLFLACLTRRATIFPRCSKEDRWKERIDEEDMRSEKQFIASRGLAPPDLSTQPEGKKPVRRGVAKFELPDEIVAIVLAMRLTETMETARSVHATLSTLVRVSPQFHAATNTVVEGLRVRVQQGCRSLLSDAPQDHTHVVRMLETTRLTLRKALGLKPGWHAYVRARLDAEREHGAVKAVRTRKRSVG